MLRNIHAVALNTFREAIRDRILHVLILAGIVMILLSYAIGYAGIPTESADNSGPNAIQMQPYIHNRNKIIMDVSLGAMWFLNVVICVFIGTGMIYKEIDKRTLFTVLTKPIDRFEFILGKYAGLAAVVLMLCGGLGVLFLGYVYAIVGSIEPALYQALASLCLEMLLITAIAIAYGSVSTPVLSAVLTTLTVWIGENVR
ncbi:MAG TPA: ABC transporter permease subunit, partial [Planctomycetota bacterium]|nr:ABC transporter permease subunit [Planctomycetota bacterium]